MGTKECLAMLAISMSLATPPVAAQAFSWGPLNDVQDILPGVTPSESKGIQARHQVRELAQDALASLYEFTDSSRRAIERSAGYVVFSRVGVKLFVAGGNTGKGKVINRRTDRQTFVKIRQVQGGLGFGINQNSLIFVFTNEQALRNFIDESWEFGVQTSLSAMASGQGAMFSGAAAVSQGVSLDRLTQTELAAGADRWCHEILQG